MLEFEVLAAATPDGPVRRRGPSTGIESADMARDAADTRLEKVICAEVEAAIARLEAAREEPYYDGAADESARELYYGTYS